MAAIWTGAIAFGLVNIPVKLVTAVRSHDLQFKLLHPEKKGKKEDLCPVGLQRICKANGKEIPWTEVVKGYALGGDEYVVLTDEDFEEAAQATSKAFEIQDFTPGDQIDPRFYEKPYLAIPGEGAQKAYALLREAMKETGRVGLGTLTLRKKQYLASVRPLGDALLIDLMRFGDEVLSGSEYAFPDAEAYHEKELEMARQLVENLSEEFDPQKYEDEYKANLEKIIEAKSKGKKVSLKHAPEPEMTGVINLMERLEESLKKTGSGKKAAGKKTKKKSKSAA